MGMTEKEKSILPNLIILFEQLPIEKKFYILGYAQAEADHLHGGEYGSENR